MPGWGYRMTAADALRVRAMFAAQSPLTLLAVELELQIGAHKARDLLQVMAEPVGVIKRRGGRMNLWALKANVTECVDARLAWEESKSKGRHLIGTRAQPIALEGPTWPSGDSTHFDVDGLGRIHYVGCERAPDTRWMLVERETLR